MSQNPTHLIWLDLEMTGLDPDNDTIIEIATLITDVHLNIVAEGPLLAIHHSDQVLAKMDDWNQKQHGQSGLIERVRHSQMTLAMAEQLTLAFVQQHVPPNTSPICGNTICQDRRFLYRYMPTLEKYFHYRHLDVSTLKELARRWVPSLPEFDKQSKHLAMNDIYDSIEELQYYRQHFLRIP
jgi:oligoribonuclease